MLICSVSYLKTEEAGQRSKLVLTSSKSKVTQKQFKLKMHVCFRSLGQDHVFRIDPSKVEDGKGKSPYDPRHNAASVLVGEHKICDFEVLELLFQCHSGQM